MRLWLAMIFCASFLALPAQPVEGRSADAEGTDEEEPGENDTREEPCRGRRFRQRKGRGRGHGRQRRRMRRRRHRHGRRHREERAEPIEFVQELIEAGKLDEARRLLDGLEGDEAVLESFRGILDMKAGRPERAIAHFERVLVLKPTQTAVWLYLGQARFQTGRFRESLRALEKGAAVGRKLPAFFQLKARAEKELGLVEAAYGSLEEARGLFPGQDDLVREQALLLVGEGLYAAALSKGQEYLARRPEDRDGYLILGEALRKAGRPREAAVILEQAALRFDQDPEILARLAFAYSTDHRTLAAARLFAKATRLGGEHAFAAAEHFRLAGRFREAMQMNARVQDPKKKLSQRLAIYLGSAHFSRAAALEGALVSATALDDTCRYRLAYANLRTGDLQTAERLAREVEDAALKESAGRILARIAELRARQAGTL